MRKVKLHPKKTAKLPNATTLGFAKCKASPGDWLIYLDEVGGQQREYCARLIGVIESTENDGLEDCTGMLCVAVLSQNGTHFFERWISPEQVTQCYEMEYVRENMQQFLHMSPQKLFEWVRRG